MLTSTYRHAPGRKLVLTLQTMTATRLHFTSIMFGKPQKQPRLSVEQHPSLARKPAYTSPTGLSAPHPGKRTT